MKVFLLGLPGSGKTTLGKQLASKLKVHFVDLDLEIEREARATIRGIFEARGEIHFREMETRILSNCCDSAVDFVMATGGGTPCFNGNMDRMNRIGKSIFLDVSNRAIAERIRLDGLAERPLLASLGPVELDHKLDLLKSERIRFYRQAHLSVSGTEISADEIADLLGKEI